MLGIVFSETYRVESMSQRFLGRDRMTADEARDRSRCLKGLQIETLNGINLHKTLKERSKFVSPNVRENHLKRGRN